jgi:hypothetical protein
MVGSPTRTNWFPASNRASPAWGGHKQYHACQSGQNEQPWYFSCHIFYFLMSSMFTLGISFKAPDVKNWQTVDYYIMGG